MSTPTQRPQEQDTWETPWQNPIGWYYTFNDRIFGAFETQAKAQHALDYHLCVWDSEPDSTGLNHKGYDGKTFRLTDDNGNYWKVGDEIANISGPREFGTIQHIHAPHKPSSEGFVTSTAGYYYASVYGLKFEEV